MMRLPRFHYLAPESLGEAAIALADAGPDCAVLAGGTDLLPNMKRRQQTPATVIGLRNVASLRARTGGAASGITLGALTRISEIESDAEVAPALSRAASLIATPPVRNMATIGGNLCLDTRCSYYDQGAEWRAAIGHCLKKEGDTCWVAPGSDRCRAVSSSDTAPVLCAIGAEVTLTSRAGDRRIPVSSLFADDGIAYLTRRPDEILSALHLPARREGERSAYVKVRRRNSFDFPVLGVAAWVRVAKGVVEAASLFIGGTGSRPEPATAAATFLTGRRLDDEEAIREAAQLAAQVAKPLQNTDFPLAWRKRVAAESVSRALRELR